MTKNIIVLDENNKETGRTYPKRAKGLVKSGRARFVDGETIRLIGASSAVKERKKEKMKDNTDMIKTAVDKIDALLNDSSHIEKAFATIEKADQQWKAESIMQVAAQREETIRKAMDFYMSMTASLGLEQEEEEEAEETEED